MKDATAKQRCEGCGQDGDRGTLRTAEVGLTLVRICTGSMRCLELAVERLGRRVEGPQPVKGEREDAFQARVVKRAKAEGWTVYHTRDSRGSEAGWPDLQLARGREVIFRELKSESGTVKPEQEEWLRLLRSCGLDVAVWRPSMWEGIAARLSEAPRIPRWLLAEQAVLAFDVEDSASMSRVWGFVERWRRERAEQNPPVQSLERI